MVDNGMVHGNLDPRAQEFIPRYPFHQPHNNSLPLLPNQFYYPAYPCPPQLPPPLPPSLPPYQVTHMAYVSSNQPVPTPFLPTPSSMATRTLLLSMVPVEVSESIVRRDLEVFGDVRAVQMGRLREGIVTVHFYDLRHARTALMEIHEQNMQQQCRLRRHYEESIYSTTMGGLILPPLPLPPPARGLIAGRAVWAQFTFPLTSGLPDGNNQGTLVIFNLDSHTSSNYLRDIFQAFGHVKELRETPMKRHQRFVEFYDVRDAARALMEMNGKEIDGKQLLIEFSRPGGNSRRFSRPNYSTPKFSRNSINNNYNSSPPQKPQRVYTSHSHKSNYGNPSGSENSSGSGSVQDSLASLYISNNCRHGKIKNAKTSSKTISPSSSSVTITTLSKQQPQQILLQVKSNKPWKHSRDYDPRFLINEDAIMESNCSDTRTTVMIKNIPNKYSQKLLLNMLDNHCIHCNEQIADGDNELQPKSSYDFVYLPIDFINKCNVGYGFVNMTSPQATLRLYKAFHHQSWEVFNSRKICQVTYARLQGIEALKEHFKNSKFPCEAEEYMPVIFSPPRDGNLLTEAVPIVGRGMDPPPPLLLSVVTSDSASMEQQLVEEVGRLVDDNENGYMDTSNDDKEARNGGVNVGVGDGEDYDDDNNNDSRSFASICMLSN